MNGSENGYAGALFFALMSFGALIKVDDVIGWLIGAICAFAAAISLRQALLKSAQASEEDHQRVEIQFQQLRNKVGETSEINAAEIHSINETAQIIQEDLQIIRVRVAELNNLTKIAENSASIRSNVASLDENSSALNIALEKATQSQNSSNIADEIKKLIAIEESNKTNLQIILKLLQVVGQMMKNPVYTKDLEKISSLIENLAKKISNSNSTQIEHSTEGLADFNRQDLSLRKKIAAKLKQK